MVAIYDTTEDPTVRAECAAMFQEEREKQEATDRTAAQAEKAAERDQRERERRAAVIRAYGESMQSPKATTTDCRPKVGGGMTCTTR